MEDDKKREDKPANYTDSDLNSNKQQFEEFSNNQPNFNADSNPNTLANRDNKMLENSEFNETNHTFNPDNTELDEEINPEKIDEFEEFGDEKEDDIADPDFNEEEDTDNLSESGYDADLGVQKRDDSRLK
ncbi:hypothetical protein ACSV4D_16175 [Flavobacterium sp. ARAG 55.4]|uniref:hypothetical protein n=1 Tax=Flavobacterium sp. ARAG 55.4 TaxID=3451357 RepID=UPI003F47C187